MADVDLSELAPLARIIAETLRDTPLRLGAPDTTADLIGALTVKVAAYIGREVLPPGALDEARPPETSWDVEVLRNNGKWARHSRHDRRADALEEHAYNEARTTRWEFRVVRATTIHTIEQPPTRPAAGS